MSHQLGPLQKSYYYCNINSWSIVVFPIHYILHMNLLNYQQSSVMNDTSDKDQWKNLEPYFFQERHSCTDFPQWTISFQLTNSVSCCKMIIFNNLKAQKRNSRWCKISFDVKLISSDVKVWFIWWIIWSESKTGMSCDERACSKLSFSMTWKHKTKQNAGWCKKPWDA